MKILMVNKFLHPNGGSETYIFKLGEELIRQGHEVQYFGMEHERRVVGNHAEAYTSNMDFHTGKLQKLLYPFKIIYSKEAYDKMWQILNDFQPDVVHLNNINFQLTPSVIDAVKKYKKKTGKKVKIMATAHDYQWVCPNHMMMIPSSKQMCFACEGGKYLNCSKNKCIHNSLVKSVLGSAEAYFYKWNGIYKEIDKVICPSEFLNQKLSTNPVFKDKTITMHNFITSDNKEQSKVSLPKIPKEYVIYFGRYAEEKGISALLEVCRKLPHIDFVFAGNGSLEAEVNKVGNIINVGFQTGSDLKQLIMGAKFFVFPSQWYENCPFAVIEAQLLGTPVVASDLGGTKELVVDKQTGELYPGEDSKALEKTIETLWQDDEKIQRYKSNCKQVQFDSLEEYCKKILELYR